MKRNLVEWAVLVASLASIAVLVGVLIMQGLAEHQPPDPRVVLHPDQARQGELGWIIPATVSNGGDEAAEAVVLEARAEVEGRTETSTIEINFLPAGTNVDVAFSFAGEPSGAVDVVLVGYRVP